MGVWESEMNVFERQSLMYEVCLRLFWWMIGPSTAERRRETVLPGEARPVVLFRCCCWSRRQFLDVGKREVLGQGCATQEVNPHAPYGKSAPRKKRRRIHTSPRSTRLVLSILCVA